MASSRIPPKVGNALSELNRRRLADLQTRQRATTILPPEAMTGGPHSVARLLQTTLGGQGPRPITDRDLITFRRAVTAVGKRLRTGITSQEVIDLSAPADRERARRQIPYAIPARLRDGEVVFSVSAGPDSRVARHMVTVQFVEYGAAVSRPGTALQAAAWLGREAHLKFDCDCEHHRYRLRYIATVGGYNAGRPESGFPKLTNPTLTGIACKHVLRVMADLHAGAFVRKQIATMVQADRDRLASPRRVKPQVILLSQPQASEAPRRPMPIRTQQDAQRRALAAGLRKVLPKAAAGAAQKADIQVTLAALEARKDVSAQAILTALQQVLRDSRGAVR